MGEAKTEPVKAVSEKVRHYPDYNLLFVVLFLVSFGLIMIFSTTSYTAQQDYGSAYYYLIRQTLFAGVGLIGALIISRMDYHWICRLALPLYPLMVILQFAVLKIGDTGGAGTGSRRWLTIGGLRFQPSEMSKVVLILFFALLCSEIRGALETVWGLIKLFIMAVPLMVAIAVTNLSTAIVVAAITYIMLFVASRKVWFFIAMIGAAVGAIGLGILMFPYRMERLVSWQNVETAEDAYQIRQSLYAIGSGGIFGKGLGQSIQKMDYLPEAHNDMIFGIICEELGLFGGIAVIALFVILLWRCMIIANNAPDMMGSMIVVGIMAQIGIQVFINVGVATNFLPNTGIPLPFISYGGTSLTILLGEIGLVLGVSRKIRLEPAGEAVVS